MINHLTCLGLWGEWLRKQWGDGGGGGAGSGEVTWDIPMTRDEVLTFHLWPLLQEAGMTVLMRGRRPKSSADSSRPPPTETTTQATTSKKKVPNLQHEEPVIDLTMCNWVSLRVCVCILDCLLGLTTNYKCWTVHKEQTATCTLAQLKARLRG